MSDSIPPSNDRFKLYRTGDIYSSKIIRLVFAYWGISYEDEVIRDDQARRNFVERHSINDLPALQVNEKFIDQRDPLEIARFVANKSRHLSGRTPSEKAEVDKVYTECKGYIDEMNQIATEYMRENPEASNLPYDRVNDILQGFFSKITPRLERSTSGFLVGEHLTWVDLLLFFATSHIMENESGVLFINNYPKVKEHHRKVTERNPEMQLIRQRRLDATPN